MKEAAGDRFDDLELNSLIGFVMVTDDAAGPGRPDGAGLRHRPGRRAARPAGAGRDARRDGRGARVAAGRVRDLLLVDRVGRLGDARPGREPSWPARDHHHQQRAGRRIGTHRALCGERVFTIDAPSIGPERHEPLLVLHGFPDVVVRLRRRARRPAGRAAGPPARHGRLRAVGQARPGLHHGAAGRRRRRLRRRARRRPPGPADPRHGRHGRRRAPGPAGRGGVAGRGDAPRPDEREHLHRAGPPDQRPAAAARPARRGAAGRGSRSTPRPSRGACATRSARGRRPSPPAGPRTRCPRRRHRWSTTTAIWCCRG